MNQAIFFFFYNFAHQSDIFDQLVVFFAVYFPFIVVILAVVFLLMHHEIFKAEHPLQVFLQKRKEILLCFFSGGAAWVLAKVLKILIHTTRPFDIFPQVHSLFMETGYAFPSGHATFFSALAFSLFFYHKKVGYWFLAFALIIGVARIIAGVHSPADILGGFAIGFLVAYFLKNI